MKDILKAGLIVADDSEYSPILKLENMSLTEKPYFGRAGHEFKLKNNNRIIKIHSVNCGIGMVNAAAAAMYLLDDGCEILLNYGLSGGISNICMGQDVIGTGFVEHDFDLTCLGYKKCEKPGQKYLYTANEKIVDSFFKTENFIKGGLASGDCFVNDSTKCNELKSLFNTVCCDMETAAIASVADMRNIPFISVRRVSDDASEDAPDDYRETNNKGHKGLLEKFLSATMSLFNVDELWEQGNANGK